MTTKEDTATYDGRDLHAVRYYAGTQVVAEHSVEIHLRTVQFDALEALYWCAVDGRVYAFAVKSGKTCIATVEDVLCQALGADSGSAYVIFKPQNHGPKSFKRWCDKWSKRTAPAALEA